jgi:hypothetical protein
MPALHLRNILDVVTISLAPVALVAASVWAVPGLSPIVIWSVPAGLALGIHRLIRRYPRHWYPALLIYVPLAGAVLVHLAWQISWHLVGRPVVTRGSGRGETMRILLRGQLEAPWWKGPGRLLVRPPLPAPMAPR